VSPDDLPERLAELPAARSDADATSDVLKLPARLDWLETQAIAAALRVTGGNRTKAAAILGINRVTLQNKLGPQKRSDR
jgi:DNA-binding NtrC family response regulator